MFRQGGAAFRLRARTIAVIAVVTLATLGLRLAGLSPAASAAGAPSPTGRNPRLIWTPEWQATWQRARAENNIWWQRLKWRAEQKGGPDALAPALVYQITGEPAYAEKAWELMKDAIDRRVDPGEIVIMLHGQPWMITYDWIYPWLKSNPSYTPTPNNPSTSKQAAYLYWLNYIGDNIRGTVEGGRGTGLSDSDSTVGHYFFLADLYGATRDHNPRAKEMIEGPLQAGPQGMLKVGGLMSTGTATETGPLTMRNAITWYCNLAAGGVWPESSDYNLVTPQLLMVGVRAVETSIGPGYFPEVNAVLPDLAAHHLLSHTSPLFSGSYQWGDVERLRYLWITHRLTVSGMYAGMLADERVGPWLQQFTEELTRFPGDASEPVTSGQYPYTPFFLLFDPYAPKADWRNSLPSSSYGRTMGLLLQRSGGWSDNSSLFGAQAAAATGVDHEVTYFADFQLWRKGEWAVTHPLGWGWWNQRSTGDGANSMLIGGLGAMSEARGPVAEEIGPNDEFSYLAGATGGQFLQQGFNDGPAIYLHEWTRSTVYLPSRDGHSDTIVVYDRVNAEDPRKLYGYARYAEHNWDRAMKPALENYPVKQWFIHMPVEPTLTADAISWSTPKGQMVRVNTLLPADQRRKVVNEKTLWYAGDQLAFADRERKWQVRVVPGQERQWDTFLNVVQAFDGGAALSNTLVRSAGGEAEGVTVHRGSHPDTLLMFGAVPSPKLKQPPLAATYVIKHDRSLIRLLGTRRLLHQGYRASWTAGAGSTELLLFDLDPAQGWRVKIDEQPAVPLKVSRSGLARITAEGTGEHSLALSTDVKPAN